jgi:hypothetical protein
MHAQLPSEYLYPKNLMIARMYFTPGYRDCRFPVVLGRCPYTELLCHLPLRNCRVSRLPVITQDWP